MSIQELIRKYRANIASNQSVGDSLGITLTNEDISRLSLANDKYRDFIKDLQTLQSEHKAEIEKAYKAGEGDGAIVALFSSTEDPPLVKYKSAEDYYQKNHGNEKIRKGI